MVEPLECLGLAKMCHYEQAGTVTRHDCPATTRKSQTRKVTRSVCRNPSMIRAWLSLSVLLLARAANSGGVTCYEYESSFYISYTIEPEGECAAWAASANTLIGVCADDGLEGTLICDRVAAASDGHAMIKTAGASGSVHLPHAAATAFLPSLGGSHHRSCLNSQCGVTDEGDSITGTSSCLFSTRCATDEPPLF